MLLALKERKKEKLLILMILRGMAIHSSILAWRIAWTEESGRLQSTGLQRDMTEPLSVYTHMTLTGWCASQNPLGGLF